MRLSVIRIFLQEELKVRKRVTSCIHHVFLSSEAWRLCFVTFHIFLSFFFFDLFRYLITPSEEVTLFIHLDLYISFELLKSTSISYIFMCIYT